MRFKFTAKDSFGNTTTSFLQITFRRPFIPRLFR